MRVPRHCDTALGAIATFQDDGLLFVPEPDSTYSSYGYVLLGAALEGAGREPLPHLMRRAPRRGRLERRRAIAALCRSRARQARHP